MLLGEFYLKIWIGYSGDLKPGVWVVHASAVPFLARAGTIFVLAASGRRQIGGF